MATKSCARRASTQGRVGRRLIEALESRRLLAVTGLLTQLSESQDFATIVGGEVANSSAWPAMASLQTNRHFCGGTLITPDAVVTAAHCVAGVNTADLHIVLGRHDLTSTAGTSHEVSEIIIHPEYDANTNDADLAIVMLASPSDVAPLSIARADQTTLLQPDRLATVLGWGDTEEGGQSSNLLREVTMPIVANEVANQSTAYDGQITSRMLAAGLAIGGKDSCQGDSGGPLIVQDDQGQPFVAGVVSWGDGCARPDKYGIYTRVVMFSDWIDQLTRVEPTGYLRFNQRTYAATDVAHLRLTDADLIGTGKVEVTLTTLGGDRETVEMMETHPGCFDGQIPLAVADIQLADQRIQVLASDELMAEYADLANSEGVPQIIATSTRVVVDDWGDSAAQAGEIAFGEMIRGEIGIAQDVDWLKFPVSADQVYRLEVRVDATLSDSLLELYDESGIALLETDDDGGDGLGSLINWQANYSGVAYAAISAHGTNIGIYHALIGEHPPIADDHANDIQQATPIRIDETLEGTIGTPQDVDWFAFSAEAGQVYSVTTELRTLGDSSLRLVDSTGQLEIAYNDDYDLEHPDNFASRLEWRATETGVYYIEVLGFEKSTGDYTLTVAKETPSADDHGDDVTHATSLEFPARLTGTIESFGDVDWFVFDAAVGVRYVFTTELMSLEDSVLTLRDSEGTAIVSNDDSVYGLGLESELRWNATLSGTYYVEVAGRASNQHGTYHLNAFTNIDDVGNDVDHAQSIPVDTPTTGYLGDSHDRDWFRLSVTAGQAYELWVNGTVSRSTTVRVLASDGRSALATSQFDATTDGHLSWMGTGDGICFVAIIGTSLGLGRYDMAVTIPRGDANRDGRFNSSDLVRIFQQGQYEDLVSGNSEWSTGDWNGDHEFDSTDLILAFQRGTYEGRGA